MATFPPAEAHAHPFSGQSPGRPHINGASTLCPTLCQVFWGNSKIDLSFPQKTCKNKKKTYKKKKNPTTTLVKYYTCVRKKHGAVCPVQWSPTFRISRATGARWSSASGCRKRQRQKLDPGERFAQMRGSQSISPTPALASQRHTSPLLEAWESLGSFFELVDQQRRLVAGCVAGRQLGPLSPPTGGNLRE